MTISGNKDFEVVNSDEPEGDRSARIAARIDELEARLVELKAEQRAAEEELVRLRAQLRRKEDA